MGIDWSQFVRDIKCAIRGHRPEGPSVKGEQKCARCHRLVFTGFHDTPEPEPTPDPAPTLDHIVARIYRWYGPNLSGATVDSRFALEVRNNGRDWSPAPSDWRPGAAGPGCPGDCNVMCCAAYKNSEGQWVGGKFDWNRPRPSPRDMKNIVNGYNGWQAPAAGTEMVYFCYTADGNRVSLSAPGGGFRP